MKKAIQNAITALKAEIGKLTTATNALRKLDIGDVDAAAAVQTARQKAESRKQKAETAKAPDVTAAYRRELRTETDGPRTGRPPTAESVKLMNVARTAAEPFTAASLAVGSGLDAKLCSNRLGKWQELGYVAKVARGEYERTKAFPQEAPTE